MMFPLKVWCGFRLHYHGTYTSDQPMAMKRSAYTVVMQRQSIWNRDQPMECEIQRTFLLLESS